MLDDLADIVPNQVPTGPPEPMVGNDNNIQTSASRLVGPVGLETQVFSHPEPMLSKKLNVSHQIQTRVENLVHELAADLAHARGTTQELIRMVRMQNEVIADFDEVLQRMSNKLAEFQT